MFANYPNTSPSKVMYPGTVNVMYPGVVNNPPLPYKGSIGHQLQDGEMLVVQGYVPPHCTRFSINLQCGSQNGANIALHINPRFEGTNQIVRNSLRNGAWESEERFGDFPLQHGQTFEMILMVQMDCYKIAFNGKHFTTFQHRMPKECVDTLTIDGNVNIQSLRFQPPANPVGFGGFGGAPMPPAYSPPAYSLQVPYTSPIPGGLYPGKMILISGVPLATADRFSIDLVQNRSQTIALHFNPRMRERVVVRNHNMSGVWGAEERTQPCFPFQANVTFDIIILCEQNQFKVAVNSKHFITFAHRMHNLHDIDVLNISDGLKLNSVRFQ